MSCGADGADGDEAAVAVRDAGDDDAPLASRTLK